MKNKFQIITAGMIVIVLLLISTTSVFAQTENPEIKSENRSKNLEDALTQLNHYAEKLENILAAANERIDLAENRLEELSESMIDTQEAEAALETFKTAVADSNDLLIQVQTILSQHTGFNENGEVVQKVLAAQTIQLADEKIRAAWDILQPAMEEAQGFFNEYIENLPANPEMLEESYQKVLAAFDFIESSIENVHTFIENAGQHLDEQSLSGEKIEEKSANLEDFKEIVNNAETILEDAKTLLFSSDSGFDTDGNVLDPETAQQTLLTIREQLKQIQQSFKQFKISNK